MEQKEDKVKNHHCCFHSLSFLPLKCIFFLRFFLHLHLLSRFFPFVTLYIRLQDILMHNFFPLGLVFPSRPHFPLFICLSAFYVPFILVIPSGIYFLPVSFLFIMPLSFSIVTVICYKCLCLLCVGNH